MTQVTFQERVRDTFVLVRLDVDGPPHTNPDGTFVPVPHLHEYREGYGDKWAREAVEFTNTNDMWQTLIDFLHFCNVQSGNKIQKQLFQ